MNATLSPAELRTLTRAAEGATNPAIAQERGVSVAAIRQQLAMAFCKLGADDREHAVRIAFQAGIIRIGDHTTSPTA